MSIRDSIKREMGDTMILGKMKCPYCEGEFDVDDYAMANNLRFRCPYCRKLNEGSSTADDRGVLIGVSIEELRRQCIDFPTGFPK